jgi:hypothetical protein
MINISCNNDIITHHIYKLIHLVTESESDPADAALSSLLVYALLSLLALSFPANITQTNKNNKKTSYNSIPHNILSLSIIVEDERIFNLY